MEDGVQHVPRVGECWCDETGLRRAPRGGSSARRTQRRAHGSSTRQSKRQGQRARRSYGYDAEKKVKGRKRHVLVDVLGFILVLVITSASVQDRDGAAPVIEQTALAHLNIQKIWVDGAYTGEVIQRLREETGIDIEVVRRTDDIRGFLVLPRRWVVERTLGWLERFRLLNREYERAVTSSSADVYCAMSMILTQWITSAYSPSGKPCGFA